MPKPGRGVVVAGLAVVGLATVAVGSAVAIATYFARTVITPPRTKTQDLRIVGVDVDAQRIRLVSTVESRLPGRYGLWFDRGAGHLRMGAVVGDVGGVVERVLERVDFGVPTAGARARLDSWFHLAPEELGVPFSEVAIEGETGVLPAWRFDGDGPADVWVLHAHGWSAQRAESLRAVAVLHEAGYTNVVTSFRNDGDGAASEDGLYRLGETEWRDLEAAVRYAVDQGARRIVLFGFSMGGEVVLQLLLRSALADRIAAAVLDSPVVDWRRTLDYQGELRRLPSPVRSAVLDLLAKPWGGILTGQREPIDLASLDVVSLADRLATPILVLHSDDDGFVPAEPSRDLALARPDLVTLVPFETARHVKLWNYAPERWSSAILDWLRARGLDAGRR